MCEDSRLVKIADIIDNGCKIDIMGWVRKEAVVYVESYNEKRTQQIVQDLENKIQAINRELRAKGFFFNEDIGNAFIESEIIVYLLKNKFNIINLDCAKELGQQQKALYYDKEYIHSEGRVLKNMVEGLYYKHYEES